MKIKRLSPFSTAIILSFSALASLSLGGVAHAASGTYYKWTGASSGTAGLNGCTSNCWSVPGNWDVSNDGGNTYAVATSAPNSTDNSNDGDNLVFDNSSLTAATTLTDDISNLVVNTITSSGLTTGSYTYTVNGQSFTLMNGELGDTENSPGANIAFTNDMTIGATQSYGVPGQTSFDTYFEGTITIPANVTLTADAPILIQDLAGAGNLILTGPLSTSTSNVSPFNHSLLSAGTTTGTIEIQNGAVLIIYTPSALGTASLTIDTGGQLDISNSSNSSSATVTIPNAITMSGDGGGAAQEYQGAIYASKYDSSSSGPQNNTLSVILSGAVTLGANTELASGYGTTTTYNLTGSYTNGGFTLSTVSADQPTYGSSVIEVNGQPLTISAAASSTTSVKAPKTPDTGLGLFVANAELPIIGSVLMAGGIYLLSRKLRFSPLAKRG